METLRSFPRPRFEVVKGLRQTLRMEVYSQRFRVTISEPAPCLHSRFGFVLDQQWLSCTDSHCQGNLKRHWEEAALQFYDWRRIAGHVLFCGAAGELLNDT